MDVDEGEDDIDEDDEEVRSRWCMVPVCKPSPAAADQVDELRGVGTRLLRFCEGPEPCTVQQQLRWAAADGVPAPVAAAAAALSKRRAARHPLAECRSPHNKYCLFCVIENLSSCGRGLPATRRAHACCNGASVRVVGCLPGL